MKVPIIVEVRFEAEDGKGNVQAYKTISLPAIPHVGDSLELLIYPGRKTVLKIVSVIFHEVGKKVSLSVEGHEPKDTQLNDWPEVLGLIQEAGWRSSK